MTAYISVSYSNRKAIEAEVNVIIQTLNGAGIHPTVFVDCYSFSASQEHEMMIQAMSEIDRCDFLLAEVSDKGIGIGVEVGYAKAKGKPVVYVRNQNAEHSTTVSGISDFQIIYADITDLRQRLSDTLTKLKTTYQR